MAALTRTLRLSRAITNVSKLFNNLSLSVSSNVVLPSISAIPRICQISYSTPAQSASKSLLMQFFDDPKNWHEKRVKTGRAWKKDELRIKSNEDLHKLWYVLLKERNMLMTMEHACAENYEYFPSPERIDKVEESMENLETVVRERNQAYHFLETGEHGERPTKFVKNQLGLVHRYRFCQHAIPKYLNKKWRDKHIFSYGGYAVSKFLRKFREKIHIEKRRQRGRDENHVKTLLRRFPNMDMEALKAKYPNVDIEKVKLNRRSRPHYVAEETDAPL